MKSSDLRGRRSNNKCRVRYQSMCVMTEMTAVQLYHETSDISYNSFPYYYRVFTNSLQYQFES